MATCSAENSLASLTASVKSPTRTRIAFFSARASSFRRPERVSCCSTEAATASRTRRESVSRMAMLPLPCSDWASKFAAIQSGSAESSAMTRISLGPGKRSIPTVPKPGVSPRRQRHCPGQKLFAPAGLWCPKSKGRDGLCTSHTIDFSGAAFGQGAEQGLLHRSISCRGCYAYNLRHAGRLGQCAGHNRGRDEGRSATRNIDSNAAEWIEPLADDRPFLVLHEPALAKTPLCERPNVCLR